MFEPHCEIAYCMGLIVGEGCFSGDALKPSLTVRLHASDPLPLLDLRNVFGGELYGPYFYNGRHSRVWMLRGWQLAEGLPYFDRWLPRSRKREQYDAWRAKYERYFIRITSTIPVKPRETGKRAGFEDLVTSRGGISSGAYGTNK